jgi:MraZ protein
MTAIWRGRFTAHFDSKGRFRLPQNIFKLKKIAANFFITNNVYGQEPFLDIYSEKAWLETEKELLRLPQFSLEVQAFKRFYLASAVAVTSDASGRLLIPQELRAYANLEDEVILIGAYDHFEVWSKRSWQRFHAEVSGNFSAIQKSIADLMREKEGKK